MTQTPVKHIETDVTSEIRLFTDDCIVYRNRTIKLSVCGTSIRYQQIAVMGMLSTCQMNFNPDKCHILPISHKCNGTIPSYHLGQNTLSVVDSYLYLGVTISPDLCWDRHVFVISIKATRVFNFVCRVSTDVPLKQSPVWAPGL